MSKDIIYDGENSFDVQKFLEDKGLRNVRIRSSATFGKPYAIMAEWMDSDYKRVGIGINAGDVVYLNSDGEIETVERPLDD